MSRHLKGSEHNFFSPKNIEHVLKKRLSKTKTKSKLRPKNEPVAMFIVLFYLLHSETKSFGQTKFSVILDNPEHNN